MFECSKLTEWFALLRRVDLCMIHECCMAMSNKFAFRTTEETACAGEVYEDWKRNDIIIIIFFYRWFHSHYFCCHYFRLVVGGYKNK